MSALFALVSLAALSVVAGCSPKIGDKCEVSTDCSATGDRLCDITEPGGYCTVFDCEPDGCPDEADCINFGTELSAVAGCTVSQSNSPYQRSFCMANCKGDGDCRSGYQCVEPDQIGGVEADYTRSSRVCGVLPISIDPAEAGNSNQVCLGSDAGLPPDMSSGGGSNHDAGPDSAGADSGGNSGASD